MMLRFFKYILLIVLVLGGVSEGLAQSANNDCSDAIFVCVSIDNTSVDGNTLNDTDDGDNSSCSDADNPKNVWYQVYSDSTTNNAKITVSSSSTDGHIFTVFNSADGTCGALTETTCQAVTSADGETDITFTSQKGRYFYIQVETKDGLDDDTDLADHNFEIKFSTDDRAFVGHPSPFYNVDDLLKCVGDPFSLSLDISSSVLSTDSFTLFFLDADNTDLNINYWSGSDTTLDYGRVIDDRLFVEGFNTVCIANEDEDYSSFSRRIKIQDVTTSSAQGQPMCIGTPSLFIGSATSGGDAISIAQYQWTYSDVDGTVLNNTTTGNDSVYYTPDRDSLIVKLKVFPLSCNADSIIDTVAINPAIVVNIDAAVEICEGNVATICTNPINGSVDGVDDYTYLWQEIGGAPAPGAGENDSICLEMSGLLNAGSPFQYEVRVTDTVGCYTDDTTTITVALPPTLDSAYVGGFEPVTCGDTTGWCEASTVRINYSVSGGGSGLNVIRIYKDLRDTVPYAGAVDYEFTIDSTDTLLRFIAYDDNGCDDTLDVGVWVHPLPRMTLSSVCLTSPTPETTLGALSCAGGAAYTWTSVTDGALAFSPNNTDATPDVDFTGKDPGFYTFQLSYTNATTGCVDVIQDSVFVDSVLNISLNATDSVICEDADMWSHIVLGTGVNLGDLTIQWEQNVLLNNDSLQVAPTGDSSVEVRVTKGSCIFDDTLNITYTPTPTAVINASVLDSICINDTVTLNGTGSETGVTISYDWESQGGLTLIGDSVINGTQIVMTADDSITLLVTNSNGNCVNTAGKNIGVKTNNPFTVSPDSVCNGTNTTINLTANPPGQNYADYTFTWSTSSGNFGADSETETNDITTATTFYLQTDEDLYGCSYYDSVTVYNYPIPTIDADPGGFCVGSVDYTSTIAVENIGDTTEYDWTNSAAIGLATTATNLVALGVDLDGQAVGTYSFEVDITKTYGNCSYTLSQDIVILNNLDAIKNFTDTTICQSDSIILKVNAAAGDSFLWVNLGANSDSTLDDNRQDTLDSVIVFPYIQPAYTTYQYEVRSWLGTCSDRDTFVVRVHTLPNPTANDTIFCAGDSISLMDGTVSVGHSYLWSSDNVANNGTIGGTSKFDPNALPNVSGDFIVIETIDSVGCAVRDTATVGRSTLPSIAFTLDPTVTNCLGTGYCLSDGSVEIDYTVSSTYDPMNLTWNISNLNLLIPGHSGNNYRGVVNGTSFFLSDTTMNVQLIVTDSLGCQDSLDTNIVRLRHSLSSTVLCITDNPPVSTFTIADYCGGGTTDWTSLNGGFGGVITPADDEQAVIDFTGLPQGTYNFLIATNDGAGACLDTIVDSFTIGQLITPSIYHPASPPTAQPDTVVICPGTTDSLIGQITGDGVGVVRTWVRLRGGASDTLHRDTSTIIMNFTADDTVGVLIELICVKDGCEDRDTMPFVVLPLPEPRWIAVDSVCIGESVILDGSSSRNVSLLQWLSNAGNSIGNENSANTNIQIDETDSVTLRVQNIFGGTVCQTDSVREIFGNTNPVLRSAVIIDTTDLGVDSICLGVRTQDIKLDGTGSDVGGDFSYSWAVTPVSGSIDDNVAMVTLADVSTTSTFTYVVTNDRTGCSSDTTMGIDIYAQSDISASNSSYCLNDPLRTSTLTVNGAGVGSTFNWHVTGDDSVYITTAEYSDQTDLSLSSIDVDVTAGGVGTYTFTCEVGNTRSGCVDTIDFTVTVLGGVNGLITTLSDTICEGDTVVLNGSGGIQYEWSSSPNDGSLAAQVNDDTVEVTPTASPIVFSDYTYTLISISGSCRDTNTVDIVVNPKVLVDAGDDVAICSEDSVQIGGSPTGSAGYTYTWSNGITLDDASLANPMAKPNSTYTYAVDVVSAEGCTGEDSIEVTINNTPTFTMSFVDNNIPVSCNGSDFGWCGDEIVGIRYAITGGSGDYTYTWNNTIDMQSAIEGAHDGTADTAYFVSDSTRSYQISILDNVTGCSMDTTLTFPKLRPNINTTDLCILDPLQQSTFSVYDVCNASYEWIGGNVGMLNSTSDSLVVADFSGQNAGDYTFTVVVDDIDKGCQDTVDFIFSLDTAVNVSLSALYDTVCGDLYDTISVVGDTAGLNYQWVNITTGDTLTNDTTYQLAVSPEVETTYEVIIDRAGCGTKLQYSIVGRGAPTISARIEEDTLCSCESIFIDGSASESGANIVYSWTSTVNNMIGNSSADSTYLQVCYTDTLTFRSTDTLSGCYRDTTFYLLAKPKPLTTFTMDIDTICRGSDNTIIVDGTGTPGANKMFAWSLSPSGTVDNPNADSTFIVVDTQTIVRLTVTDINTGCDSIFEDTVHIFPIVDFSESVDYICFDRDPGQEHIVLIPGGLFDLSVDWSLSPDTNLIIGGSTNYSNTFIQVRVDTLPVGSYNFRAGLFNAETNCPDTISKILEIMDDVLIDITDDGVGGNLCRTDSLFLYADTTNVSSILWQTSFDDSLISGQETNDTLGFIIPVNIMDEDTRLDSIHNADRTITVYIEGSKNGCIDRDTASYFVKSSIFAFAGLDNDSICQTNTLDMEDAYVIGGSIAWSDAQIGAFTGSNTVQNPTYVPDSSMTGAVALELVVTDTLGICPTVRDTMDIYLAPRPIVRIDPSLDNLCSTDTIDLRGGSLFNVNSITWRDSLGAGRFRLGDTTFVNDYIPSRVLDTTFNCLIVSAVGSKFCETNDTFMCYNITQTPLASFPNPIDTVCYGDTLFIFDTIALGPGDTVIWDTSSMNGRIHGVNNDHSYYSTTAGIDNFSVRVQSAGGCTDEFASENLSIETFPLPSLTATGLLDEACETDQLTMGVSNGNGDSTVYTWTKIYEGDSTIIEDTLPNYIDDTLLAPLMDYQIIGTDIYGCMDTIDHETTIYENPKPEILASEDQQCYPKMVDFTVSGVDIGTNEITWDFKDGFTSNEFEPSHLYEKDLNVESYPTFYDVELEIMYSNGCINRDTVNIGVCEKFGLPNVFSPNGDGVNDNFVIPGFNEMNAENGPCYLNVYNRWGQMVWESGVEGYDNNWDGTSNIAGQGVLQSDVYYYIFSCDGAVIWSGWVRIIDTVDNPNK